jgi:hypothetical protein
MHTGDTFFYEKIHLNEHLIQNQKKNVKKSDSPDRKTY